MLYILDRNEKVVGLLQSNSDRNKNIYYDDILTEILSSGADTLSFTTISDRNTSKNLIVGNYIAFKKGNKFKLMQIMEVNENKEDILTKEIYCEGAGLELINTVYSGSKMSSVNIERFLKNILQDTDWKVGYIDSNLTKTLSLDVEEKEVYSIIQEYLYDFEAEIDFRVEIKGNIITGRYIDVYSKRGKNNGKRLEINRDIKSISRKVSLTEYATKLIGEGKNGLNFRDISMSGEINKPLGQNFVVNEEAYSRINNKGKHITRKFTYDTEDAYELLRQTHKALKEYSEPKVTYEVDANILNFDDIEIGDYVSISDLSFEPPLLISARVSELETSKTNKYSNKAVLSNFNEVRSGISSIFPIPGDNIVSGSITGEQMSPDYVDSIISDSVNASLVKTEILLADKANISDLSATNAEIGNLKAEQAEIGKLVADKADIKDLNATNATIENLKVNKAEIEDLKVTNAEIENLKANKAEITDLNATNAKIENLTAEKADITDLNALNATIENLKANKAEIEDLHAVEAQIGNLQANKADIVELDAVKGNITHLKSEVAEIDHILAGNITADNIASGTITADKIQTGSITAGSGIIADGAIGNAQISKIDAGKIEAGTIDTSKVTIQGSNGHLRLKGNRMQVFQGTGNQAKERVSVGDVNGDGTIYGLRVRGADGQTVLLDENGVTSEGITDGSINNSKISDDANIDGSKLNINSVVSKINEDGTETIQGTKIEVDGTTLNTKLSTITTKQTEDSERITQAQSQITANTNAIKLKVDEQTYTADKKDMTSKLEKNSSEISTMKGQIALKVEQTDIENVKSEMEGVIDTKVDSAKAEIKVTTDAISQNVSNLTQTVSNKADGSTVSSLNSKVSSLETSVNGISGKVTSLEKTTTTLGTQVDTANTNASSALNKANSATTTANNAQNTANTNKSNITDLQGEVSTVKSNVASLEVTTSGISQKVSSVESTTATLSGKVNTANNNATNALNKANSATTLADSKAKVFTSTPTVPYKVGDLWVQGTNGDVMKCKTARASGSYTASDWEKASKYTDDTKANAVDGKVTTLQGTVNTTNSKVATLETNLNGITQRVSSTESTTATLTNKVNTVEGTANTAKSTADSAKTTATNAQNSANSANSKIDNLEIGSTNLILGTKDFTIDNLRAKGWYNQGGFTIAQDGDCKIATHSASGLTSNSIKGLYSSYIPCKKGDTFTVSVYIKVENVNNWDEKKPFIVEGYNAANTRIEYVDVSINHNGSNKPTLTNNEWTRFIYTYTITNVDTVSFGIRLSLFKNGKISFKKAQIEKGNKVSDWSIASDDLQFQIDTTTTEISKTKSQVSEIKTDLNGITSRVSNVETNQTTTNGKVSSLETRMSTAESKITETAITNTVKKNFYTKTETDSQITSKGYQTASQVQQTVNGLQVKVSQSGGYNLIKNSTGASQNTRGWTCTSGATLGVGYNDGIGSNNRYFMYLDNGTATSERFAFSSRFKLKPNTKYTFVGYFHNYTTCPSFDVFVLSSTSLADTDTSTAYTNAQQLINSQNTNGSWKKFTKVFTTPANTKSGYIRIDNNGYNSAGTNSNRVHWNALLLVEGELELPWSPHPSEIYDGITAIDKDGITVTSSNVKSKTSMSSSGFKITKTDTNEDVFKVNADGTLYMKGQITVTGGSIPTSNLSGTISSNQLNSTITNDISTAKNNASNAVSTANTAKSTADSAKTTATTANNTANTAKTTADSAKSTANSANNTANSVKSTVDSNSPNWSNAYNRVKEWASGAVTGTTTINGGMISANTITASKLALMDFTNYSQLNEKSASSWGFSYVNETSGTKYTMNSISRDKYISETHLCNGGETFRIKGSILTTCKGYLNSSATSATYLGTAIGIYCYNGTGSSVGIVYSKRVTATSTGTETTIDSTVTIPSTARKFRIFVQTEGVSNFSGAIMLRNIQVLKCQSGELIVDGAITANKIASGAITAGMITTGTLDASKVNVTNLNASNIKSGTISGDRIKGGTLSATNEINFVGGARIFGNSGAYDAGLFISAQQHELMHGNVYIGENLNVSKGFNVKGATTLSGTVTCNALNSNGQISAKGLSITGNAGVSNQFNAVKIVTNGVDVYGYTNLDGNVHISGNLGIVGDLSVRNKAIYGMNNIALARGTVYLPQGGGNNTTDYLRIGGGFMAGVDSGNFHFLTRDGGVARIYAGNVSTAYSLEPIAKVSNHSVFDEINSVNVVDTEEGLRLIDNPVRVTSTNETPKAVYTTYNEQTEQEEVNIDYTTAISTLWKAIQELKQENDELKEIIKDIHSKL